MAQELSKKEIYDRMQELRNLRKLHESARNRVLFLEERDKLQKEEIRLQKEMIAKLEEALASFKLRIEELERMVFGKKKKKKEDKDGGSEKKDEGKKSDKQKIHHRRPVPKEEEVTKKEPHPIDTCADCGTTLEKKTVVVFYVEDIILGSKEVTKHTVEKGWCPSCKKWVSAIPLPFAKVVIGEKAKIYLCYLSILLRLSFEQIRTLFMTTYHFDISDGEISHILEKESVRLRPEYEALKEKIRKQKGVHYDETSWKVQNEEFGNHAWVMTGTETPDAVFDCGKSRGKKVAEGLKGESEHIGISDDYGAYRNMFTLHQLCWAHPNRKFRDLAESETLEKRFLLSCQKTHKEFSDLYHEVSLILARSFNLRDRMKILPDLLARFDEIAKENKLDPKKLAVLKASLRKNRDCYFVCVVHEGIPADNNKAERSLRHLILKRNSSFGSKTQRGAERTSILASVILSLFWNKPTDFFGEMMKLGRV